jgi:hypothetical protein
MVMMHDTVFVAMDFLGGEFVAHAHVQPWHAAPSPDWRHQDIIM